MQAAEGMAADHAEFAVLWPPLAAMLQALAEGREPDVDALQAAADAFCRLHDRHLALEDDIAFPAAAARAGDAERSAMSADMAQRRGVKP